jgi:hypothetical protein
MPNRENSVLGDKTTVQGTGARTMTFSNVSITKAKAKAKAWLPKTGLESRSLLCRHYPLLTSRHAANVTPALGVYGRRGLARGGDQ